MDIPAREATLHFSVLPFLSIGLALKGKNLLLMEQIHTLKIPFGIVRLIKEANRKSLKLFPFVKWIEKCKI